jgi:hypothetical protein
MLNQWDRKRPYQFSHFDTIALFPLDVFMKRLEPRCECAMLLDVLRHEAGHAGDVFDLGKEAGFLGVVVVVHGFAPALAICGEVAGCRGRDGKDLEMDGVEAADYVIVG